MYSFMNNKYNYYYNCKYLYHERIPSKKVFLIISRPSGVQKKHMTSVARIARFNQNKQ